MSKQIENLNTISNETFLGLFDTDGSVLFAVDSSSSRKKRFPPFRIRVIYSVELSSSKQDLIQKVANTFRGRMSLSEKTASFRASAETLVGMEIRNVLLNNVPRHPGRYHDFLLSEEVRVLNQQGANKTKEGLVTLITLAYNNKVSEQAGISRRKMPLEDWYECINPSQDERLRGLANAILDVVRTKVSDLEKELPTMIFSTDYVRGAHFGDGFLTVGLAWHPQNRRRTEFSWGICGQNKAYCQAFVNTFNAGYVNKSGPNCYSFVLAGTLNCIDVFYIFEDTWMPAYKRQQFNRFQNAIELIQDKRHMTIEGTAELLDLVYDMSEKGTRSKKKEQFMEIGIQWLISRGLA